MGEKVKLHLRFVPEEEPGRYIIRAEAVGLDVENLKVEISMNGLFLTVTGRCVPTAEKAEQMRSQLSARFEHVASIWPHRFSEISGRIDEAATEAYVEMGQGKFGFFSTTFRIPKDVDTLGIQSFYRESVLLIVLPRGAHFVGRPNGRRWTPKHRSLL